MGACLERYRSKCELKLPPIGLRENLKWLFLESGFVNIVPVGVSLFCNLFQTSWISGVVAPSISIGGFVCSVAIDVSKGIYKCYRNRYPLSAVEKYKKDWKRINDLIKHREGDNKHLIDAEKKKLYLEMLRSYVLERRIRTNPGMSIVNKMTDIVSSGVTMEDVHALDGVDENKVRRAGILRELQRHRLW